MEEWIKRINILGAKVGIPGNAENCPMSQWVEGILFKKLITYSFEMSSVDQGWWYCGVGDVNILELDSLKSMGI